MEFSYDVIVVGAGHAGCEAAHASAKLGKKTLLITFDLEKIAAMSCNPSVGGVAKGQIVREIDALGGMMGIIADRSAVQFRMLNRSKGPAVWSPRAQSDRRLYSTLWRQNLENTENLFLFQDNVVDLIFNDSSVVGVITQMGFQFESKVVILTAGTFLNGKIHIGEISFDGGRMGDRSNYTLSEKLRNKGFIVNKLKTGTPVRIDSRSIDFSKLIEQKGDNDPQFFSFTNHMQPPTKQLSCWIAYTDHKVHQILRKGFDRSPLFKGIIQGVGPRYCPSIEDKLKKFADKDRHQLFLEPEGWNTTEFYLNGFSSSLPWEVQLEALHNIQGFENAHIFRPGYAIEYDFFDPTQLKPSLETKLVNNLFFAGQINGTTGYEEAAAQGLIAGINAALKIDKKNPLILKRNQAYIGVLIDDLIYKGVNEPYRMFTSRAEFRILLRHDNADERLTPFAYKIGMVDEKRYREMISKYRRIEEFIAFAKDKSVKPEEINEYLTQNHSSSISQSTKLIKILSRPEINLGKFIKLLNISENIDDISLEAESRIKYQAYIEKEKLEAEKIEKFHDLFIPDNFDFDAIQNLSTEARQKLKKIKPKTIGEAISISGVNPSDIIIILMILGR